jgi:mRNA-degrading endonuclease RelE of RelBE toxin-antitoxin system
VSTRNKLKGVARVVLTPDAVAALEALSNPIHGRVLKLLYRLEKWPNVSGAKPLRGKLVGSYRLRTGDYRVQFRTEGETVIVDQIGHRDGFYED